MTYSQEETLKSIVYSLKAAWTHNFGLGDLSLSSQSIPENQATLLQHLFFKQNENIEQSLHVICFIIIWSLPDFHVLWSYLILIFKQVFLFLCLFVCFLIEYPEMIATTLYMSLGNRTVIWMVGQRLKFKQRCNMLKL